MYLAHWGLNARPFDATADARFHYPADPQQAALLKLRYAVENRLGAALVSGGTGLGKTFVVQTLLRQLPDHFQPRLHVVFPDLTPAELLAYLAQELTGTTAAASADTSLSRCEQTLRALAAAGQHAVLAVDEAHLLRDSRTLHTLRLMMNWEHAGAPALTIVLAGQPPLLTALDRCPEWQDRLAVQCLLRPFDLDETWAYVQHRLTAAGAGRPIFEDDAYAALHEASQGLPRRINRLADLALLVGFAEELPAIGRQHVEAVADEMTALAPE